MKRTNINLKLVLFSNRSVHHAVLCIDMPIILNNRTLEPYMLTFVLGAWITAATSIMLGIKLNSLFVVYI